MRGWIGVAGVLALLMNTNAWAFPSYASGDGIWGAHLMTAEERQRYVRSIQGMKNFPECQAFVAAHRQEIQARARSQQVNLPPAPSRSPCEVMQAMGRFGSNHVYVPSYEQPAR